MRVLLDTNILARSAGPQPGLGRELVQLAAHHRHVLVLSPFLVTELGRVLRYERVRRPVCGAPNTAGEVRRGLASDQFRRREMQRVLRMSLPFARASGESSVRRHR